MEAGQKKADLQSVGGEVTPGAAGGLSAINGVMGAKAERSLVFHVVGMPSYQNQRLRKTMHHTLGNGVFDTFINISAQAACCHAVIDPDNCVIEMERVIADARRNNQVQLESFVLEGILSRRRRRSRKEQGPHCLPL